MSTTISTRRPRNRGRMAAALVAVVLAVGGVTLTEVAENAGARPCSAGAPSGHLGTTALTRAEILHKGWFSPGC